MELPKLDKYELNLYLNILHHAIVVWYNRNSWHDLYPFAKTIEVYFADQLKDVVKNELFNPKHIINPIWETSNKVNNNIYDI